MARQSMNINRILLLTVLLLVATSIGPAMGYEVKKEVDGYNIVMKIDRNPPVAGDNHISIEVADTSGRCICDADVAIEYSRPAMAGMPPMDYKATTRLRRGRYVGTISLPVAGAWNIAVKIVRGSEHWITSFTVDVE
jgi:hypothetical protein